MARAGREDYRRGMTTDDPHALSQGVLAYKLALAILSTLQDKGVLSEVEVERILLAAKISASQPTPTAPPLLDLDLSSEGPQ